jgi:putative tricarboxylic transport membrane protein
MIRCPLAEQQFHRALAISQGDLSVFLTRPLSAALLAVAVLVLVAPAVVRFVRGSEPRLPGAKSSGSRL